mgnify:CR=1 FL=1
MSRNRIKRNISGLMALLLCLVLVISGTANFILTDINNKLDLTNEDLMEENEVLREKMRSNWDI